MGLRHVLRISWAVLLAAALTGCPEEEEVDDDDTVAPPSEDPIEPTEGAMEAEPLDCTGAYAIPDELTGDEGLGYHGWTWDDLEFAIGWPISTTDKTRWVSDNTTNGPSIRVQPQLVPEVGTCYSDLVAEAVAPAADDEPILEGTLVELSAFGHAWDHYDELERDRYVPDEFDLDVPMATMRAIRGLYGLDNELPDAPDPEDWDDETTAALIDATADYPQALDSAVARLVIAVGEAYLQKLDALEEADLDAIERIHDQFFGENWSTQTAAMMGPVGGTVVEDIEEHQGSVDTDEFYGAAMVVASSAEDLARVLADVEPLDSPGIDVLTPHGRILVSTAAEDSTWTEDQLEDAVVVVDLGGDDVYHGRYAATHELWMSASVVVDGAGNDLYSPDVADIEAEETTASQAFDGGGGFTQGCGLFGVGVLVDGAGDDTYTATVHAQGDGVFGVGLLYDLEGADSFRLGTNGQGTGHYGIGVLADGAGDDYYGVYTMGQGAGKPRGHGVLLDMDGDDIYIGYYNEYGETLPGPGFNNYHGLNWQWPYSDDEGKPHYMSICQGVGWGYRGDWFTDYTNRAGGFGALIDLGEGDDQHYADCMAQGQGFVYGFGYLYDGGGDDLYHTFWWGPAASAHMGVSLMVEEGGNDEIDVVALSGGYGYDSSVGWVLDHGGDDTYNGQFNYGRAYTYGLTFMINTGGDDTYNADEAQGGPRFGIVDSGDMGQNLIGVFMDLGGGTDTYVNASEHVVNDAVWYNEPTGSNVDAQWHKGIGMDR